MRVLISIILGIAISALFIGNSLVFSQEETSEPETQWVMGEVVSADSAAKTLTLKYLDYETGEDAGILINANDKTTLENLNSLDELVQGDSVSVDYVVAADGTNLAASISLEGIESPAEGEVVPEALEEVE